MRDFLTQLLQTFITLLASLQAGKLLKRLLKDLALFKVFELLELGLVYYISLEILEALIDTVLNCSLIATLRHGVWCTLLTELGCVSTLSR